MDVIVFILSFCLGINEVFEISRRLREKCLTRSYKCMKIYFGVLIFVLIILIASICLAMSIPSIFNSPFVRIKSHQKGSFIPDCSNKPFCGKRETNGTFEKRDAGGEGDLDNHARSCINGRCIECANGVCRDVRRKREEGEEQGGTHSSSSSHSCTIVNGQRINCGGTVCADGVCYTTDKRALEGGDCAPPHGDGGPIPRCETSGFCYTCDWYQNCSWKPRCKRGNTHHSSSSNCVNGHCMVCTNGQCHETRVTRQDHYTATCTNGKCVECRNGVCRNFNVA